jgi:hypothetical protein
MSKTYNFFAEVPSSNGRRTYKIKVDEKGLFSCNCPSWIFNQRGNRTCKHIDALRREGLTVDGVGRLITGVDGSKEWGNKVPILCKNYPTQCDACNMRFICWTNREAEFDLNQLRQAGIYKDR